MNSTIEIIIIWILTTEIIFALVSYEFFYWRFIFSNEFYNEDYFHMNSY